MGLASPQWNNASYLPTGYGTPAGGYSTIGVSSPSSTMGLQQMPSLPKPPFLESAPSLAPLPTPWELAPNVMNDSYSIAKSVPISTDLPVPAEIPPPHIAAPWVFLQDIKVPSAQNGFNNYNNYNTYNTGNTRQQPTQTRQPAVDPQLEAQKRALQQAQQQAQQAQQAAQRAMQQAQQQQQAAQQAMQQAQQAQQQAAQKKSTANPQDTSGLDDDTIRSLNKRLNNDTESVRSDAAMDLYKILEKNPSLATDPHYSDIVRNFIEKIMDDRGYLGTVRAAGELIMQMGLETQPSEATQARLKELSQRGGLTGEDRAAGEILGALATGTFRKPPAPNASASPGSRPDLPPTQAKGVTTPEGGTGGPNAAQPQGAPAAAGQAQASGTPAEAAQAQAATTAATNPQTPPQAAPSAQAMASSINPMASTGTSPASFPSVATGMGMPQPASYAPSYPAAQSNMFSPRNTGATTYPYQYAAPTQTATGQRLNLNSPQNAMAYATPMAGYGNRLNIQEGYR